MARLVPAGSSPAARDPSHLSVAGGSAPVYAGATAAESAVQPAERSRPPTREPPAMNASYVLASGLLGLLLAAPGLLAGPPGGHWAFLPPTRPPVPAVRQAQR